MHVVKRGADDILREERGFFFFATAKAQFLFRKSMRSQAHYADEASSLIISMYVTICCLLRVRL
jgi:hypothetical protein